MTTIANQSVDKNNRSNFFTQFKNSRFLQLFAVLLIVQLVFAALLNTTNQSATFARGDALFALQPDDVENIAINNEDETINLSKQGETWEIEADIPLPVDATRVQSLLSSMANLKTGLPIASSVNAQEQLEVADDKYQRKLVINNDKANTFLLGTSPGLRKAHLRREGSNDIYSVSLPVSDVPTSKDQWLDKSLLAIGDISQITSNAITFERAGTDESETWSVPNNDADGKSLDTKKLLESVQALETLRVTGLYDSSMQSGNDSKTDDTGSDSSPAADESTKPETVNLQVNSGADVYKLVLNKTNDTATIKRDDIDQAFSIPTSLFDKLAILAKKEDWFIESSDKKTDE